MRYLEHINEYKFNKEDFEFITTDVKMDVYFTDKNISYINGKAVIEWFLDFNFKGNKGVEVIPVIKSVKLYLNKGVYIDNEIEEEFEIIEFDKNIKIETNDSTDSIERLYYPYEVEYYQYKNEIIVYI